jgi:hypothetical protein
MYLHGNLILASVILTNPSDFYAVSSKDSYMMNCVGGVGGEEECLLAANRPRRKYLPSRELRSAYIVSCIGFMAG